MGRSKARGVECNGRASVGVPFLSARIFGNRSSTLPRPEFCSRSSALRLCSRILDIHWFPEVFFIIIGASDLESPIDFKLDEALFNNLWEEETLANASSYVKLYLYTRDRGLNSSLLIPGVISSLEDGGFNPNKTTKVVIHGWLDNGTTPFSSLSRDAYLSSQDINIIVVDWSVGADTLYPVAVSAVVPVGKYIAQVLDWLVEDAGVSADLLHIIGHSLGAHIGGVVGSNSQSRIGRISGLDPAGPGFLPWFKSSRLDSSDAEFVDVIHTDGTVAGYFSPCGHVDFYPNNGMPNQPGCTNIFGGCNHIRSYLLFVESVASEGFTSWQCGSWKKFTKGECDDSYTTLMGERVDLSARGKFYLRTAGSSPYALGNNVVSEI